MHSGYRLLRLLARLALAQQMRLTIEGIERVPASGPLLLVANHLGNAEALAIGVHIPRVVRILAKADIFEWPVIGTLARSALVIPIRRSEPDRKGLRAVQDALNAGHAVLIFPEATYAHAPDLPAMIPFKPGVAWLAYRTGVTIVPVGIWGFEAIWMPERGWKLWHRPEAHVVFGEPMRLPVAEGTLERAAVDDLTEELAVRIAALLPEVYRGVYASRVPATTPAAESPALRFTSP